MAENENLPPRVIKEIAKELKSLDESPPGGIKVVVNDDNFSTIFADTLKDQLALHMNLVFFE